MQPRVSAQQVLPACSFWGRGSWEGGGMTKSFWLLFSCPGLVVATVRGGGQGSCWRGSPILLSSGPDSLPGRRGGQRISRGAALPLSLSQVPLKDQLHLANRPHPFSSFPLGLRSNHSQGKNKQQTLRTKRMGKRPRWLGDFSCSRFVSGSSWPDAGNVMEQGSRGLWSFPKGALRGN